MGINTQSAIVVGLPYAELKEKFPGLGEALENDELDSVAPSYDAPHRECIIGFRILRSPRGSAIELTGGCANETEQTERFMALTGLEPRWFLTADVW